MRRPDVRPAPRHRDHRGVQGDRHPAVRAGRHRYDPGDPRRSDIDLWQREITVRGKGGKDRIVRIGHQAARSLNRYLRARARHAQAWRPQLWLGINNREPLTAAGIYQMIARRGRQCGVARAPPPVPAPLQPHLARPRRTRRGT
jgi:integrase